MLSVFWTEKKGRSRMATPLLIPGIRTMLAAAALIVAI